MGTDRYNVYSNTCMCGQGTLIVDECSPDHPYARQSQTSWEAHFRCSKCSVDFVVKANDHAINVYNTIDIQNMDNLKNLHYSKCLEIEQYVEHNGYYDKLERIICSLRTKKAIYEALKRYLVGVGGTYQTFIKHFPGCSKDWLKKSISPKSVKAILNISDPVLDNLLVENDNIYRQSTTMPSPIKTITY